MSEASSRPRVSGVSGSSETRMSVRASNASSPSPPWKLARSGIDFGERLQPATSKPIACSLRAASRPSSPRPSNADAHLARGRLRLVLRPDPFALLAVVEPELAKVQQDLQHDPLAHARRQVGIDDAHDRRFGQARVDQHVVDAGAEREDRLAGSAGARRRRGDGASSGRSARGRDPRAFPASRSRGPAAARRRRAQPGRRVPAGDRDAAGSRPRSGDRARRPRALRPGGASRCGRPPAAARSRPRPAPRRGRGRARSARRRETSAPRPASPLRPTAGSIASLARRRPPPSSTTARPTSRASISAT